MKRLMPSLREKKRYLEYEISGRNLTSDPTFAILNHTKSILGVFQSGEAGILGVSYDEIKHRGIIKMNLEYVDKVRTALMLLKDIKGERVSLHTRKVSGNLAKLRQAS